MSFLDDDKDIDRNDSNCSTSRCNPNGLINPCTNTDNHQKIILCTTISRSDDIHYGWYYFTLSDGLAQLSTKSSALTGDNNTYNDMKIKFQSYVVACDIKPVVKHACTMTDIK